jgi:hypothetical protein
MKIRAKLRVAGNELLEETLEIDDYKLEELSEEEVESAVQMVVSHWANSKIEVEWETEDEEQAE